MADDIDNEAFLARMLFKALNGESSLAKRIALGIARVSVLNQFRTLKSIRSISSMISDETLNKLTRTVIAEADVSEDQLAVRNLSEIISDPRISTDVKAIALKKMRTTFEIENPDDSYRTDKLLAAKAIHKFSNSHPYVPGNKGDRRVKLIPLREYLNEACEALISLIETPGTHAADAVKELYRIQASGDTPRAANIEYKRLDASVKAAIFLEGDKALSTADRKNLVKEFARRPSKPAPAKNILSILSKMMTSERPELSSSGLFGLTIYLNKKVHELTAYNIELTEIAEQLGLDPEDDEIFPKLEEYVESKKTSIQQKRNNPDPQIQNETIREQLFVLEIRNVLRFYNDLAQGFLMFKGPFENEPGSEIRKRLRQSLFEARQHVSPEDWFRFEQVARNILGSEFVAELKLSAQAKNLQILGPPNTVTPGKGAPARRGR